MKRNLKFFILTCTCLTLLFLSNLSTTVYAETYDGKCGDNLSWEFNQTTGTLIITGYGMMDDFLTYEDYPILAPWYDYREEITSLSIAEGVTTIGYGAFKDLTKLQTVKIPDSVEIIYDCAFSNCSSLKSITLPKNLETIPLHTFFDCTELTEIHLPDNLKTIGMQAFRNCVSLKTITFPEGLETIEAYAFFECTGIEYITIPSSVKTFEDGVFFNCENLQEIQLSEGLKEICDYTFTNCQNLKKINIPSGIKSIGTGAFMNCTSLTDLILPDSVYNIEEDAFENASDMIIYCKKNSYVENYALTNGIPYLNADHINCPVGKCGNNLIWHFEQATGTLNISGNGAMDLYLPFEEYEDSTKYAPWYNYRDKIISLSIEEGIYSIGSRAFLNLTQLKTVTLPESTQVIYDDAFSGCISLEQIQLPKNIYFLGAAFANCRNLKSVTLPDILETLSVCTFLNCTALKEVHLPKNLKNIGTQAFRNCVNLESVILPESLETIDVYAFLGCSGLQSITIPSSVTTLSEGTFLGCISLRRVCLPESIIHIEDDVFKNSPNVIIHGTTGSYAETYANANGIPFVAVNLREALAGTIEVKPLSGKYRYTVTASGGSGKYTYDFLAIDSKTGREMVLRKNSAINTYIWNPKPNSDLKLKVRITDTEGERCFVQ